MIKGIDGERVSASGYFHNHQLEGCHDGTAPAVQPGLTGNYPVPVSGPADREPSPTPRQATTAFGG